MNTMLSANFSTKKDNMFENSVKKIGLFIPPSYSMSAVALMTEVLNIANMLKAQPIFDISTIGLTIKPIESFSGVTLLPDREVAEHDIYDWVIICGSTGSASFEDRRMFNWLRRLDRQGTLLGAVTSGPWILARAGLLDNHKCTLHWYDIPAFREEFPDITITQSLYELDRRRITCVGGVAVLDMILHLISQSHGALFAQQVNQHMINDRMRPHDGYWSDSPSASDHLRHPKLPQAVKLMENHIEDPLPLSDIAKLCAISPRSLTRIFHAELGINPKSFYLKTRLTHARDLVENSRLSLHNVALASGFSSLTRFGQAFKKQFGYSPNQQRKWIK